MFMMQDNMYLRGIYDISEIIVHFFECWVIFYVCFKFDMIFFGILYLLFIVYRLLYTFDLKGDKE